VFSQAAAHFELCSGRVEADTFVRLVVLRPLYSRLLCAFLLRTLATTTPYPYSSSTYLLSWLRGRGPGRAPQANAMQHFTVQRDSMGVVVILNVLA